MQVISWNTINPHVNYKDQNSMHNQSTALYNILKAWLYQENHLMSGADTSRRNFKSD